MTKGVLPAFNDLPVVLPVFPLSGALLLPRGRLPLNIFEPRYIAMIDDALGPLPITGRMIGMIQPHTEGGDTLYRVGCAGRIVAFSETEDSRYLITLEGAIRFTMGEELSMTRGYRRVVPVWDDYRADLTDTEEAPLTFNREKLIVTLRPYFKLHGIMANWETIDELSPEKLVIAVATACPFGPNEKQALLEAKDLMARFDLLITLLDMATRTLASTQGDGEGMRH
jgi:Lon protease-like protein